jgi:hypothetical protein
MLCSAGSTPVICISGKRRCGKARLLACCDTARGATRGCGRGVWHCRRAAVRAGEVGPWTLFICGTRTHDGRDSRGGEGA